MNLRSPATPKASILASATGVAWQDLMGKIFRLLTVITSSDIILEAKTGGRFRTGNVDCKQMYMVIIVKYSRAVYASTLRSFTQKGKVHFADVTIKVWRQC